MHASEGQPAVHSIFSEYMGAGAVFSPRHSQQATPTQPPQQTITKSNTHNNLTIIYK